MKNTRLYSLAIAFGIMCAVFLAVLWRGGRDAQPIAPAAKPAASPSATAHAPHSASPATAENPAVRRLTDALARMQSRKDVRPNETVLTFKNDAAMARFLARAGKEGLTVLGQIGALRSVRVRYSSLDALQSELAANADDYADVSGNYVFNVPQPPTKQDRAAVDEVPFGNDALAFIGAIGDRGQWGRGVKIAILDTGVAPDPTFGAGRVSSLDVGFGLTPGHAADDAHGTSVASLAAGALSDAAGVAPAADILSIRVTDAHTTSDIFTIAQAIVTAVDAGAKIINVSLGGYATNDALNSAITYATNEGAVIVAAAGNDQAAQLAWPAADPRVVSVGAVDKAEQQVSFSNSGPQLQLTAPGYGVETAWSNGQRAYVDGTSASAPLVSGSVAALMSQNPTLTAQQAVDLLTRTADDAGAPGRDPAYGNGILNLGWALNANNPNYADTAISSHYYDAANGQMDFVVQNRSGHAVADLTLSVASGSTTATYPIASLGAGESQVIKVPVDATQLAASGQIAYSTTLTNPPGFNDQVPANNHRTSVLVQPKPGQ